MFSEKWRKANSTKVLLLFRDETASDWASLCHVFDLDPNSHDTPSSILRNIVWGLIEANLLVTDNPTPHRWSLDGGIKASDNVPQLLRALDLSLKEMAAIDPRRSMFIEPSFGRPDSIPPDKQLDLFILMPFSSNIKGVYEDHIKSVAASLNLKVARADDFFTVHAIVSDIWTAICKSRVILADCTGRNPNVFYEIGLAHTVGKPVGGHIINRFTYVGSPSCSFERRSLGWLCMGLDGSFPQKKREEDLSRMNFSALRFRVTSRSPRPKMWEDE